MMENMTGMMLQMSGMMGQVSNMMQNMPTGSAKQVSGLMSRMATQMMDMSKALAHGRISEKELNSMNERMSQLQNSLSEMQK
jgi:hypothetical protein